MTTRIARMVLATVRILFFRKHARIMSHSLDSKKATVFINGTGKVLVVDATLAKRYYPPMVHVSLIKDPRHPADSEKYIMLPYTYRRIVKTFM